MSAIPPGTATPAEEYDRRRIERREAAQRWIARLNRWWLIGQLATLALLCAGFLTIGPQGWLPFLLMEVAWGLSLFAAGGSAGVALWNWSSLPGPWLVIGLAPWAILLMEVTVIVLGIL